MARSTGAPAPLETLLPKEANTSLRKVRPPPAVSGLPDLDRQLLERIDDSCTRIGRYHLYVSYACPWAHRTLITRILKGLEEFIDVTIVSPHMGEHGWPFAVVDAFPGAGDDPVLGANHVKDIYLKVSPDYEGRYVLSSVRKAMINLLVLPRSEQSVGSRYPCCSTRKHSPL